MSHTAAKEMLTFDHPVVSLWATTVWALTHEVLAVMKAVIY